MIREGLFGPIDTDVTDSKVSDWGVEKFSFSEDGLKLYNLFREKFNAGFGHLEPTGDVYCSSDENKTFFSIPSWETKDGIIETTLKSMEKGKDLFPERYKGHKFEYEPGADY